MTTKAIHFHAEAKLGLTHTRFLYLRNLGYADCRVLQAMGRGSLNQVSGSLIRPQLVLELCRKVCECASKGATCQLPRLRKTPECVKQIISRQCILTRQQSS